MAIIKSISAKNFYLLLQTPRGENIKIIDVRTSEEYEEEHIPSIENIPLDVLADHLHQFSGVNTIYIHCKSGVRSQNACELLDALGFSGVCVNVEGGILAWKRLKNEQHHIHTSY